MALPWSPLLYPSSLTRIHRLNASHSEPSRKWAGLQVSKANLTGQGAQAARRGRNSGNRNGRRVSNRHDLIKTIFKTKGKTRSPTSSYPRHPSPTQFAFRPTAFRRHSDTKRFFFFWCWLGIPNTFYSFVGVGQGRGFQVQLADPSNCTPECFRLRTLDSKSVWLLLRVGVKYDILLHK